MLKKIVIIIAVTFIILTAFFSFGNPKQPPNIYELGDNEFFKVTYLEKGLSPKTIWFYNGYISLDEKNGLAIPPEIIDNFNSSFSSYYSTPALDRSSLCEGSGLVKYEITLERKFWRSRKWSFSTNSTCVGPLLFQYLPKDQPQESWPDARTVFKDILGEDN